MDKEGRDGECGNVSASLADAAWKPELRPKRKRKFARLMYIVRVLCLHCREREHCTHHQHHSRFWAGAEMEEEKEEEEEE